MTQASASQGNAPVRAVRAHIVAGGEHPHAAITLANVPFDREGGELSLTLASFLMVPKTGFQQLLPPELDGALYGLLRPYQYAATSITLSALPDGNQLLTIYLPSSTETPNYLPVIRVANILQNLGTKRAGDGSGPYLPQDVERLTHKREWSSPQAQQVSRNAVLGWLVCDTLNALFERLRDSV